MTENGYYDEAKKYGAGRSLPETLSAPWPDRLSDHAMRFKLIRYYAFAIPTEEALGELARLSPLVEVGAGTGYWTALLRERGATVQAFDTRPIYGNHFGFRTAHAAIARGDHVRAMRMYGERNLLICWPDYEGDWSAECLALHRGEYVAYIGEGMGGCTGTDDFHNRLGEVYEPVGYVPLPQWPGIHDDLEIWRRR